MIVYVIMKLHSTHVTKGSLTVLTGRGTNRNLIDLEMYLGLVAAFVIIAITYATAYRSGAVINPAVTMALLVTGKMSKTNSTVYCVPNIRGCYRCRCSIFNVWKRYVC